MSDNRPLPSLFVSHGAPTLVLEDIPARRFLEGLGQRLPRPRAILCVSAHWETGIPTVSAAAAPETIHDFHGFPEELYRLRYPAPGAPALADRVRALLHAAGLDCLKEEGRGLDHGAWAPLMLIYPAADIPAAQLSVQPGRGPAYHREIGRALAPLREEGVLVLGTGGAVHNLRQFSIDRKRPAAWAVAFDDWLADTVSLGDEAALLAYRKVRPEAALAQPTEEHFLPLFVAMGAGNGLPGRVLHRSFAHGSLSMAAYGWGDLAA